MKTDWSMKIRAFLRCPPEGALLTEEEAARRCVELLSRLGVQGTIPEAVECAHRGAYGMEQGLVRESSQEDVSVFQGWIHPLSAQSAAETAAPSESLRADVRRAADYALESIHTVQGDDPRKLFLALWRLLPEYLVTGSNASPQAREDWGTHPASASVPYQSVWQHGRIASALVGAGTRPAILVFNIGSAQDFLTTARRTQDLWMGSFLLSYLCWSGMKVIAEQLGPDCIVIPDLRGQPLVDYWLLREEELAIQEDVTGFTLPALADLRAANLPNIFTAIIPAESGSEIAENVEKAVYTAWGDLANAVRMYIEHAAAAVSLTTNSPPLESDPAWATLWERQTGRFLRSDVFWALVPWPEVTRDATKAFQIARRVLGAQLAEEMERTWSALCGLSTPDDSVRGALYAVHGAMAGRTLESRKNLRMFSQTEEDGEKCTLCGRRSALRPRDVEVLPGAFSYQKLQSFWSALGHVGAKSGASDGKLVGRLRRGERLCSVCLTKRLAWEGFFIARFGLEDKRPESHVLFPSTSTVATAAFKRDVLKALGCPGDRSARTARLREALGTYVTAATQALDGLGILYWSAEIPGLRRGVIAATENGCNKETLTGFLRLDGDWLYEESFVLETIEREYEVLQLSNREQVAVERARAALLNLVAAATDLGIARPDTYYALIAMDGDNMGDWLSGRRAPRLAEVVHHAGQARLDEYGIAAVRRPADAALHAALAEAAKTFALVVVPEVVESSHCGRVIYSGGDDVLAFVPLDELLEVLARLQAAYQGDKTGRFASSDGSVHLVMGNKATISAGVAVAHHAHPFSQVVELAHGSALEDDAKGELQRDAFSIRVLKRSGETLRAYAKWRCGKAGIDVLQAVEGLRSALTDPDEGISDRFIKDLDAERALAALPGEAQAAELGRLLGRRASGEPSGRVDRCRELHETLSRMLQGLREEELAGHLIRWTQVLGDDPCTARDIALDVAVTALALLDTLSAKARDATEVLEKEVEKQTGMHPPRE